MLMPSYLQFADVVTKSSHDNKYMQRAKMTVRFRKKDNNNAKGFCIHLLYIYIQMYVHFGMAFNNHVTN